MTTSFDQYLASMDLPTNPADIALNYTSAAGPESITFSDIDAHVQTIVVFAIVFGCRIGLAAVALPLTYLFTKNRRSPIFILNMSCLFVLLLQSVLFSVSLQSTYNSVSYTFSLYEIYDETASNVSIASNVFLVVLIALVEVSFCYQVYIIFESPQPHLKKLCYLATAFSMLLGIATVVLYFIYMVYSNISFMDITATVPNYLVNNPLIIFATSSCLICFILLVKLGVALRTRRHLGLTQFSLFHILFIMIFQTMIIPTILILVSFNSTTKKDYSSQTLSSLGMALITISLPITTLWANSSVNNSNPTSSANIYPMIQSASSSSDEKRSYIDSPTDYYPRTSLSESEKQLDKALHSTGEFDAHLPASAEEDKQFWREVEMYTKDLDKNLQLSNTVVGHTKKWSDDVTEVVNGNGD